MDLDHGSCAHSFRSAAGLPHRHPALPGEILTCPPMAGCNLPSTPSILLATVRPVGIYLARVLEGERTWLDPVLRPVERLIYKLCGVDAEQEMNWREYAFAMLGFSAVSMVLTYAIERLQALPAVEPAAPRRRGPRPGLEHRRQLHHQHQLAVLHARNHDELSHPDGRPGDAQLLLGGGRHRRGRGPHPRHQAHHVRPPSATSGSTRRARCSISCCPLHHLRAAAGCAGRSAEPARLHRRRIRWSSRQTQTIAQGPVASQEAIKMLGTNGGGFFNANSAHPFENPTPLLELPPDPLHLHHPRRPHLHPGPHDRLAGPGLGRLRGDVRPVRGRLRRRATGPRRIRIR